MPAVSADNLPDPDGKPADMTKPVQVYLLMGQSNMLGFGKIKGEDGSLEHAVKEKKLYPYLIDDAGHWTERKDVRNVRIMGSGDGAMRLFHNEWMTIKGGNIGPEIGLGHHVGHATDAPVLILKSCIGNRALGWDLLPPGSEGFEFTDAAGVTWVHPGYKGSPERWEKGTEPEKIGWYAGMCASLGQTQEGATDSGGKLLDAMLAVDGRSGRHPEFKGNVATVYTHPLSKGDSSGSHYGGNAETYMNVGEAMGEAMVKLLEGK